MNTTLIRCTCCQAELTAPQFYNGNPYGYTCIKKVDPSYKRTKTVYVACDSFKVIQAGQRNVVSIQVGSTKKTIVVYGDIEGQTTSSYMQNGILFVAESHLK